jgi:hypothetical protein
MYKIEKNIGNIIYKDNVLFYCKELNKHSGISKDLANFILKRKREKG